MLMYVVMFVLGFLCATYGFLRAIRKAKTQRENRQDVES